METERAGLDIIAQIREQFGLTRTRIILRTGQPGYARKSKPSSVMTSTTTAPKAS